MERLKALEILQSFLDNNLNILKPFEVFFFKGNPHIKIAPPKELSWGIYLRGDDIGISKAFCGINYKDDSVFFKLWENGCNKKRLEWLKKQNLDRIDVLYRINGKDYDSLQNTLKFPDECTLVIKNCSSNENIHKGLKQLFPLFINMSVSEKADAFENKELGIAFEEMANRIRDNTANLQLITARKDYVQYCPSESDLADWSDCKCHYEFRCGKGELHVCFHCEKDFHYQKEFAKLIESKEDDSLPKHWVQKNKSWIMFERLPLNDPNIGKKAANALIEFNQNYGNDIERLIMESKGKNKVDEMDKYQKYMDLLKANHNIILHGAPGTGKTYLARDIASKLIFSKQQDELNDEEKALLEERTGFVQFHQSYDYTDFVEGLRPAVGADGKADGFERKDGVFREFCKLAKCDMLIEGFKKKVDESGANGLKVKSVRSPTEFAVTINQNEKFQVKIGKGNDYSLSVKDIKDYLITGSYDKKHDTYGPGVGQYIKENIDEESYFLNTDNQKPYVFIIDEINRGEMSKIFGELFFSIDPGYRGKVGRIKTQYQNLVNKGDLFAEGFYIPKNIYIIGTMNDIDRSVESMDFAMRRRFAFIEVMADDRIEILDSLKCGKKNEAVKCMQALNKEIEKISGLSSAYHIGPAYFLKLDNYEGNFEDLWKYHIEGVLREYLRGMPKADDHLTKLKDCYDKSVAVEKSDAKDDVSDSAENP